MAMAVDDDIELAPGRTLPASALRWSFARSSGPGGQNVNKLNTKAVLRVALDDLRAVLGPAATSRLCRLAKRYRADDELVIAVDQSRSQRDNRLAAVERLTELCRRALRPPKKRKPTRPTRASRERRLQSKREQSDRKRHRRQRFD
jgi:ribosome-associated protein